MEILEMESSIDQIKNSMESITYRLDSHVPQELVLEALTGGQQEMPEKTDKRPNMHKAGIKPR
jgi:hypothetical protein